MGMMALVMLGPAICDAALTVRVDATGGAPRLVVNGTPVRARIFWGGPGAAPLPVETSWKEVRFEFVAAGDAATGTMHFRFGQQPGEIALDDIRVEDLGEAREIIHSDFESGMASFTRDWTFWPQGAQNTVGELQVKEGAGRGGSAGLVVSLKAPRVGKWPDFHIYSQPRLKIVKGRRYRVSFWAKATPARSLSVGLFQPGSPFRRVGGPADVFESQIRLAAEAGVNFVSFPIGMPWPKPGQEADWEGQVDEACETVLRANPNALLIPRMGMDPPAWWKAAHPDEVMQWEDGRRDAAVVASPLYRKEAAARLAALVRHLEEKYGEHIAGYHPCGQNTGEWFYKETWAKPLNGYAPADREAWRLWLKKKYGDDAALRRAWGDAAATIEDASAPSPEARHASPNGVLRDPVTERRLIDWAEFQQEAMAECVCEMAHAVREATQGRKLVLFFYGYVFEFSAVANGPATSGHYALRRVLNCPDIDVLCSPISYFDRGLGQSAPSMTAAESVALAGKMWLNEDDTHTYLAGGTPPGSRDHVTTLEETNRELTRNVAQEALRNFGTWWMDLGSSGWFNDAGMWAQMKRLGALDEAMLERPAPFRPEIAAVIDERAMLNVGAGGVAATRPGVYEAREALGRMGAPYGQYLMDDAAAGKVRAKLYVMLNAWSLPKGEQERLLGALKGAARVWCYAPGYYEDGKASLEAMRRLTGFTMKRVDGQKALATPTEAGKRLGLTQPFGVAQAVRPLFAAADARGDEVLATYPDGSAAVALRRGADGASMFVGAPGLSAEALRIAAKEAGAHLLTETDCNVYANGPFVALHAAQNGQVVVDFGRKGEVKDMLSGERVGEGPRIKLMLGRGETRIFNVANQ